MIQPQDQRQVRVPVPPERRREHDHGDPARRRAEREARMVTIAPSRRSAARARGHRVRAGAGAGRDRELLVEELEPHQQRRRVGRRLRRQRRRAQLRRARQLRLEFERRAAEPGLRRDPQPDGDQGPVGRLLQQQVARVRQLGEQRRHLQPGLHDASPTGTTRADATFYYMDQTPRFSGLQGGAAGLLLRAAEQVVPGLPDRPAQLLDERRHRRSDRVDRADAELLRRGAADGHRRPKARAAGSISG